MRVTLYARVSTHDQRTLAMQMDAMREFAIRRGWIVTDAIEEIGSGATDHRSKRCSQRLGDASWISFWCGSSTGGDAHG